MNGLDNTVLRKIDIVNWDSPVAEAHGIQGIPHLVLFRDGQKVAEGVQQVVEAVQR